MKMNKLFKNGQLRTFPSWQGTFIANLVAIVQAVQPGKEV